MRIPITAFSTTFVAFARMCDWMLPVAMQLVCVVVDKATQHHGPRKLAREHCARPRRVLTRLEKPFMRCRTFHHVFHYPLLECAEGYVIAQPQLTLTRMMGHEGGFVQNPLMRTEWCMGSVKTPDFVL